MKTIRLGGICSDFSCAKCCYDTEMILSREDIQRIRKHGFQERDFCVFDGEGFPKLRNVAGACIFLKDRKCQIYSFRPQGCRYYPIVFDLKRSTVTVDTDCPLAFQLSKKMLLSFEKEVKRFVKKLFAERKF